MLFISIDCMSAILFGLVNRLIRDKDHSGISPASSMKRGRGYDHSPLRDVPSMMTPFCLHFVADDLPVCDTRMTAAKPDFISHQPATNDYCNGLVSPAEERGGCKQRRLAPLFSN